MRKLELYNITLTRITELQKQLGMQKEKFLDGQGDYLMRVNDRVTKIRNEADSKKGFITRVKEGFSVMIDSNNKKSEGVVREMNELLRRTQTYLNIIHDVEMSESKLHTLISQAELLEEQALAQEKLTFVNTLLFLKTMTIEQKMNQLIVADNNSNLANLTPERQKLFMKCLAYLKDLLKCPTDSLLNDVAKDLYECVKNIENIDELLVEEPMKQISPLVLNSLAIVLMEQNGNLMDSDKESNGVYYYDEVFSSTGWTREYTMNEFVDINGIIDQGSSIHQTIITEIANRIETINASYDAIREYVIGMSNQEIRDVYLLNESEYKNKYDSNVDIAKLKKYVTYSAKEGNASLKAITDAIRAVENEVDEEIHMA